MLKEYHIEKKFRSVWEKNIFKWYYVNKRKLPWREKKNQNFYKIWISEVMLQQTQVSVVIPFYNKFIKKWPTLELFLEATLEEILEIWQGMGYYRRAQNLFKAKEILKESKHVDINPASLKKLPGVGDYISSAISAILKDESCAVVDGNIKRILTRVFELEYSQKRYNQNIKDISKQLTPQAKNGDYCQSLMDLANLVCKAKNPLCHKCPVALLCKSKGLKIEKKKNKKKQRRIAVSFIIRSENYFLIEKTSSQLLQNLFIFPLSEIRKVNENQKLETIANEITTNWMKENKFTFSYKFNEEVNHIFTHFHLKVLLVRLELKKKVNMSKYSWLTWSEIEEKPKSKLMKKIEDKLK
ncbi:MAG: A/G-specific adenine glycosylase [Alphaproteobacteria bacterium]